MRTILAAGAALTAVLVAGACSAGTPDDFPPSALPGHCYQHVFVPAVTETYQDRAVDVPAHTATRTIPAVYGDGDRQVLVREGRTERYLAPATYRTVTETEVVRPETTHTEIIPAEYETVVEHVLVREAHTEWRRGVPGPVSDPDMPRGRPYGDILCLIDVPAEYRVERRRYMRSPERTIQETIPAEVRTRTREVVEQPAHEVIREIPPIYSTVRERVIVQPERVETYTIEAVYRVVTRTRVVTPSRFEWRDYECRRVQHPHHRRPPQDQGNDGERGALDAGKIPELGAAKALRG